MASKQDLALQEISTALTLLNRSNETYRSSLDEKVNQLAKKVEEKHIPLQLEGSILATVQQAIQNSIKTSLEGYNSPLTKLVVSVVDSHSEELKRLINDSFEQVIRTDEFKASIVSAFSHKVARSIISNNEGLFDKVNNELKQSPVFKAKMVNAVANVIEECLRNNNNIEYKKDE